MKKIALIALLVTALFARPLVSTARADDDAVWAIAGFVGGVIAEKAVQKHKRNHPVAYTQNVRYDTYRCPPPEQTTVIIRTHEGRGRPGDYHGESCGCNSCKPAGYYHYETRQIWVPGRWEVSYDRCGNRHRTWCPGYYQTKRVKVWVSTGGYDNRGQGGYACNG